MSLPPNLLPHQQYILHSLRNSPHIMACKTDKILAPHSWIILNISKPHLTTTSYMRTHTANSPAKKLNA